MQELWSRFSEVEGVEFTARNPKSPPSEDDLPCVQFFELGDVVAEKSKRGATQYPLFVRKLTVIAETFVKGETEESASADLMSMVEKIKKKVYADGNTLGRLCELVEVDASRVLRPPVGGPVAGIGLAFEITYIEDVGELF